MIEPSPNLEDTAPINTIRLSNRIRNALLAAGLDTVGAVRETSDTELLNLQNFSYGSLRDVRRLLGTLPTAR